jgi:hypothetical protein
MMKNEICSHPDQPSESQEMAQEKIYAPSTSKIRKKMATRKKGMG